MAAPALFLTQGIAQPPQSDFAADVRGGLLQPGQKELPSKYLYDEVGSALFRGDLLAPGVRTQPRRRQADAASC